MNTSHHLSSKHKGVAHGRLIRFDAAVCCCGTGLKNVVVTIKKKRRTICSDNLVVVLHDNECKHYIIFVFRATYSFNG